MGGWVGGGQRDRQSTDRSGLCPLVLRHRTNRARGARGDRRRRWRSYMDRSKAEWMCPGQTGSSPGKPAATPQRPGSETTPANKRTDGLSGADPVRLACSCPTKFASSSFSSPSPPFFSFFLFSFFFSFFFLLLFLL